MQYTKNDPRGKNHLPNSMRNAYKELHARYFLKSNIRYTTLTKIKREEAKIQKNYLRYIRGEKLIEKFSPKDYTSQPILTDEIPIFIKKTEVAKIEHKVLIRRESKPFITPPTTKQEYEDFEFELPEVLIEETLTQPIILMEYLLKVKEAIVNLKKNKIIKEYTCVKRTGPMTSKINDHYKKVNFLIKALREHYTKKFVLSQEVLVSHFVVTPSTPIYSTRIEEKVKEYKAYNNEVRKVGQYFNIFKSERKYRLERMSKMLRIDENRLVKHDRFFQQNSSDLINFYHLDIELKKKQTHLTRILKLTRFTKDSDMLAASNRYVKNFFKQVKQKDKV